MSDNKNYKEFNEEENEEYEVNINDNDENKNQNEDIQGTENNYDENNEDENYENNEYEENENEDINQLKNKKEMVYIKNSENINEDY